MSQPYLQLREINKAFGAVRVLQDISLEIERGEFVCFLGPSGCGKTTLLRIIAGLESQDTGQIVQDGFDISRWPAARRDFGIVFQSYALFPNLTARRNIAYGLENSKLPKAQIDRRVAELLELVGLQEHSAKYPAQLSGGQQQRVALARALALSPSLLLLDEPLSALDARVRANLRGEVSALHRRLGVTTIMVTHDQEEALTMADRIVVMDRGVIVQVGAPFEIYRRPATPFAASFVGVMNLLPGVTGERPGQVYCGSCMFFASHAPHSLGAGSPVTVAIRPEDVRVGDAPLDLPCSLEAQVTRSEFLGAFYRLTLLTESTPRHTLKAYLPAGQGLAFMMKPGQRVPVHLPSHAIHIYPG
jgi:iron(III) transport system ATP-binding protein